MVRCRCQLEKNLLANCERGMPGLSSAAPIESSPLFKVLDRDLRITCNRSWMMQHLRHIVLRQPPNWSFLVVTDAQIMTAWLANIAIQGAEIFDPDAMTVTASHYSLEDLVVPPELLVLYLGVKAARNSAMPEVVLETLTLRQHAGRATWVLDQPAYPLESGHLSYSPAVADFVSSWPHIHPKNIPGAQAPELVPGQTPWVSAPTGGGRFRQATGNTSSVGFEEMSLDTSDKKKPYRRKK